MRSEEKGVSSIQCVSRRAHCISLCVEWRVGVPRILCVLGRMRGQFVKGVERGVS